MVGAVYGGPVGGTDKKGPGCVGPVGGAKVMGPVGGAVFGPR